MWHVVTTSKMSGPADTAAGTLIPTHLPLIEHDPRYLTMQAKQRTSQEYEHAKLESCEMLVLGITVSILRRTEHSPMLSVSLY